MVKEDVLWSAQRQIATTYPNSCQSDRQLCARAGEGPKMPRLKIPYNTGFESGSKFEPNGQHFLPIPTPFQQTGTWTYWPCTVLGVKF